jgi:hypothetical protein
MPPACVSGDRAPPECPDYRGIGLDEELVIAGGDLVRQADLPMVTVWPTPKGSPTASNSVAHLTASESAKHHRQPFALGIDLHHRQSVRGSASKTLALNSLVRKSDDDVGAARHHDCW